MKPFKSITGIEVNNPNICIKGNGNFACLCEKCGEEFTKVLKLFSDEIDKEIAKRNQLI